MLLFRPLNGSKDFYPNGRLTDSHDNEKDDDMETRQIEENKQYNYNKAKQASNGCLLVVVTIGKSVLCLRKFFY